MTLRWYLTALTLATLLPVAIFATIVGYFLVEQNRETFRRGAEERTLALLTAVDAELRGSITTLDALAGVPSLTDGDLQYFRRAASQILATQPDWINVNLASPDGQQLVNLQVAEGSPLPNVRALEGTFERLLQTGKPVVGDLAVSPVRGSWNFVVRVPVMREGRLRYVLSAGIKPDSIGKIIDAQKLGEGWGAVVVDRNARFVARNWEPEKYLGQTASQSLRDGLARSQSGWFRGRTVEGVEVYSPFHRSEATGWAVSMGVPASMLDAAAWRAAELLGFGLLAAVALAFWLAFLVGRRISAPIASLASATEAMGRGEPILLPETRGVAEVRSLETAVRAAAQAQVALRESEARVRSVVDHVIDGIITIDERGTVETFNPAAERIFGYAASEVVGRNVNMLMPEPYHRDHDSYVANYLRTGQAKIIGSGREVEGRRKDGSTFPMDLAVSVFYIGSRRCFTGIVRDISERKRAEDILTEQARMLDSGFDAIIMRDQNDRIIGWNRGASELYGWSRDEAFGEVTHAFFGTTFPKALDEIISDLRRNGRWEGELVHTRKDGSRVTVFSRQVLHRDGETRVLETNMDITALKQAERVAREANHAKDEFLAMLSHELRNPLAALTTAAHVLKVANPGDQAATQARGIVDRQTKNMARLIEDLLDVSRVTMGKAMLEREVLNLADVVSSVVQSWRAAGRLEGARLSLEASPVWINADRTRIEQIFSNLLDNALKFAPAGRIAVSVRRQSGEAVLEVSDEGEGIAPELIARIFDLFAQGPRGLDRDKGGLGVGLALVRQLAELHGGTASAASAGPGRGAVFTVRLPAVAPREARVMTPPARRAAGPRHILVIEDNDDIREMLRAALSLSGHEVREASNGSSGLAVAAESRPDVALIDIGLPDIDGYEVARRLRSGHSAIVLVALTGYGQAEDQKRALEAGFDAQLTKPATPERLMQVIDELRRA